MAFLSSPILLWASVLVMAGIFLPSAASKLRALDEFQGIVADYRLVPQPLARPTAIAVPILEIVAGLSALLPVTRTLAGGLAIGLFVLFALAMAINLARGRSEIDCGCFLGRQKERIGWTLVARNLVLAACASPLLLASTAPPPGFFEAFVVIASGGSALALHAAFSRLAGIAPLRQPRRA